MIIITDSEPENADKDSKEAEAKDSKKQPLKDCIIGSQAGRCQSVPGRNFWLTLASPNLGTLEPMIQFFTGCFLLSFVSASLLSLSAFSGFWLLL
jgi:hypothetical protein